MGNMYFLLFCKFSILFNRKFEFCQFLMLFDRNFRLEKLGGGHTDVRMYGRMEIHPCVLQDIGPSRPLPKKGKRKGRAEERQGEGEGRGKATKRGNGKEGGKREWQVFVVEIFLRN